MKKLMLLAAAALSVSVAQAVTWNSIVSPTTSAGTTNSSSYIYAGGTVSIGAYVVLYGDIGTGTLLSYARVNGDTGAFLAGNEVSVSINSSGYYVLTTKNANSVITHSEVAALSDGTNVSATEGAHAIAITFTRATGTSITGVSLIVDGVTVATIDSATIGSGPYGWVSYGTNSYQDDDYTGSAAYTVYDATGIATTTEVTVTTLPEPTALALLALGVAGLALRRRA